MTPRTVFSLATALVLLWEPRLATARGTAPGSTHGTRGGVNAANAVGPAAGRPVVILDRLDLSRATGAASEEKFLRDILAGEARLADWGAGRSARIQYRLRIDELVVEEKERLLTVRCTATGWLPKGKNAKSKLTFSGAPDDRKKLVEHVLSIVARGVITRLADLERKRRIASEVTH